MSVVSRMLAVDRNFVEFVRARPPADPRPESDLDEPVRDGTGLTARRAIALFEAQIESRLLDILA
jgi:hypothetical protein